MAWLDEADLHAPGRLRLALDETQAQAPLDLRRSALEELVRLVPSDLSGWNQIVPSTGAIERHGELLGGSDPHYGISIGVHPRRDETVVFALGRQERRFSERDRDVLDLVQPVLERALQTAEARRRLLSALAASPPPGSAVVLLDDHGEIEQSSPLADCWLAEHFGAPEHPGWLPAAVAAWLALPPRPALRTAREGRRLTVRLLPGDPHALLLEEEVESFRAGALEELGLTGRECEVLDAARSIGPEADLADELFLSLHAVHERLERLEAKLGVRTLADAIAAALRASI
jgi:DNA-binding CsgD family transcriptional regulator